MPPVSPSPDAADLFRAAFDAAPAAMMVMGPDLAAPGPTITHANAALSLLTGYSVDELVGRSPRLFQGPRSDQAEPRRRRRGLLRDGRYAGRTVTYRKDGTACDLFWSITAIPGSAGTVQGWLALLRDAAERFGRHDAAFDLDAHRKILLEAIPHLVWQSYDGGEWYAASPQWVAFTGQTEVASLGAGWREMIAPEDRALTDDAWRAADDAGVLTVEHRIRRHDGAYRWFQTRALPIAGSADAKRRRSWIGTSTDIDDQRTAEQRIRHLAYHDVLTDAGNRGMLRDTLERMTTGSSAGVPFNVFFLDVDDFKSINDQLGHRGGDEVLREISRRMTGWSRASDTVARVGGDEFVLVQANATPADSLLLAHRISARLEEPFMVGDQELRIGASIGIASYPRDGRDADTLLRRADLALYGAKTGGRLRSRQFEPAMELARHERQLMHAGLSRAIERDQLSVAYQVMCCAVTGTICGYEALARWTHPELGSVPPTAFIPLAEESGQIVPIGQWMLERACRDAAGPGLAGRRVAINLSPNQFRSRTLVRTVEDALERAGLPPARLELEVTERLLIDDGGDVERTLGELKALGVGIALDDFGTGYSNLEYLCRFPFDRLKIDQSFVRRMVEDECARAVVGAIVALAHNLRLSVTAEGVETAQQLLMLREMGCDEVQGFLLGRPSPASDIR